ncbi:MAG: hypothetical protein AB8G15_02725 [Saprospiraceae bacterium]
MKKLPENLDPALEQLLLEKEFQDLSATEQTWVASQLSIEQYRIFRKLLLETQQTFRAQAKTEFPDPAIKAHLQRRLRGQKASVAWAEKLRAVFYHPIPTWKVAVAFMALLLGFTFYQTKTQAAYEEHFYAQQTKEVNRQTAAMIEDSLAQQTYQGRSIGAEEELKKLFISVN